MPFTPSELQQRFFDFVATDRRSAILEAKAGSGKTTTVIRCLPRLPEHLHVKLTSFNAKIAKELNERIAELRAETGRPFANVSASTFHSIGNGALFRLFKQTKRQLGAPDPRKCAKLLESSVEPGVFETYGSFATKLVGLAKGEGIGCLVPDTAEAWWSIVEHHGLEVDSQDATEEEGIALARKLLAWSNEAAAKGSIDFDDQLYLPVLWKLRLWQNDVLFIDEAQDTNAIRRAIARLALKPGGRLFAVGDRRQSIYGFTGASVDAMDLLERDFNCVQLPLNVCYRCARAVVEHAQEIVPDIAWAPTAAAGRVETLPLEEALAILTDTDAILCRNTAPLIGLAYQLIARGRACTVLGREIGAGLVNLIKAQRARGIDGLLKKLAVYREREVAKFTAKGEETRAEAVADRVECIEIVVANLAETERTIPGLIRKIEGMFSDGARVLTLATAHRSKGLEWPRVAILRPDLMPSKWARQAWQQTQEENLRYVVRTRAKEHLIYLGENK